MWNLLRTVDFYPTVLIAIVAVILIYSLCSSPRVHKLPPGPMGLPFVGYLPFLTSKPHIKLQELKERYGSIYSLRLGSCYVVILCDYQSMKNAYNQDVFFGTPPNGMIELNKETKEAGVFTGMNWKEHRNFTLHMLRGLGFFKDTMEAHIREEIIELLGRLEKAMDKPIAFTKFLSPSTSNNVSSFVFGKRRTYEDPSRVMLDEKFREYSRQLRQTAWYHFFPWIKKFLSITGLDSGVGMGLLGMKDFIKKEIEEHEKNLDPNNVKDFIDCYLVEIQKRKNEPGTCFRKEVLEDLVGVLFAAGSDTVMITLDWLLLIAASFPDVQKRIHSEIDDVIGRERIPSKWEAKKMPYTEAVIAELLRWRSILPINLMRYTSEDTELNSYFIPKHTIVIGNLWAVLHEPELWGKDADEFKPERFLTDTGKALPKFPEYHIPFSTGKRQCVGEQLARMEVFLYYAAILQKFNVSLPKGKTPDFEGSFGLGLQPKPYELCLKLR